MKFYLINGHGGINPSNEYVTSGKRSPEWSDGSILYEGLFNRNVVNKLVKLCEFNGVPFENIVPEWQDISLSERVRRVNTLYDNESDQKDIIVLEIHANAASNESASGFELYTSVGSTKSDEIAKVIHKEYLEVIADIKDRGIKEKNFYVIKKTKPSAILIECGFMTNEAECRRMLEEEDLFVEAIFSGMLELWSANNN